MDVNYLQIQTYDKETQSDAKEKLNNCKQRLNQQMQNKKIHFTHTNKQRHKTIRFRIPVLVPQRGHLQLKRESKQNKNELYRDAKQLQKVK